MYSLPFEILQNTMIGMEITSVQIDKKIQRLGRGLSNNRDPDLMLSYLPVVLFCMIFLFFVPEHPIHGQNQSVNVTDTTNQSTTPVTQPILTDTNLRIEEVAEGFDFPTSVDFLGKNDIILLEKNTGNVIRLLNGNVTHQLTHIDVSFRDERGLLGLALLENGSSNAKNTFVFVYYTHCPKKSGQAQNSQNCGNYVYRYRLDTNNYTLTDAKLILSLPALPGPSHNGGKLLMDKEKNLFVTIGDLQPTAYNQNVMGYDTKAQNIMNGTVADGRAAILRITPDGRPVGKGILGDVYPLNIYYAYGIKNSFGIGIDPLTNNLWETENGPQFGDEINLVEPGFNSGWEKVQGIWKLNQTRDKEAVYKVSDKGVELVDFDGKGHYSSPEFVWDKTVAPTALVFLDSSKLGKQYQNDIFVGSVKNGRIYHFDLSKDRKSLSLSDDLADRMLSKKDDASKIIFGKNFGIITDLKVSPYDGYLYVVSGIKSNDKGVIYRIVPKS
ncbi:MAG TPA: PQQ-dependent sugar dehydrogenase [Nitrososphaeraceae archaeon]